MIYIVDKHNCFYFNQSLGLLIKLSSKVLSLFLCLGDWEVFYLSSCMYVALASIPKRYGVNLATLLLQFVLDEAHSKIAGAVSI